MNMFEQMPFSEKSLFEGCIISTDYTLILHLALVTVNNFTNQMR